MIVDVINQPQETQANTIVSLDIGVEKPFEANSTSLGDQMVKEFEAVLETIDANAKNEEKKLNNGIPIEKSVCIFESIGGNDKGNDGFRKDTKPIVESLEKLGWYCEVVKFTNEQADEIFEDVKSRFIGYVPRINPGSLPDNEKTFFDVLRKLSKEGLVGMPHPDSMINFGAKSTLFKLNQTGLVPYDTYVYYNLEEFKKNFAVTLTHGDRVLKQNRGSTGEGIWWVSYADERPYKLGDSLPLDTKIKCTEAVDNHVEYRTLDDFMNFCEQYLIGDQGMLVDMKFLPRIKEGEIRVLLVGEHPIYVVHKKPADHADAFSATLFSGAKYRYDKPSEWKELIEYFHDSLPKIKESLNELEHPLIWTVDFILDYNDDKTDKYVLGEINCSCVGFTSHLDEGIQEEVAKEIILQISHKLSLS